MKHIRIHQLLKHKTVITQHGSRINFMIADKVGINLFRRQYTTAWSSFAVDASAQSAAESFGVGSSTQSAAKGKRPLPL